MIVAREPIVSVIVLLVGSAFCPAADQQIPCYVGRKVCLMCHVTDHTAPPCALKPIPEHDKAYHALSRSEAVHIAALCGVADQPSQSLICLGCHATGADAGPRWATASFDITDGVQCEACHGAGSRHADSRRSAVKDGSTGQTLRMQRSDSTVCAVCHRERPSHQAVLEQGYRRPQADFLYKTPVNLATSPDGRSLYVVCERSDSLLIVDVRTAEVRTEIAVGRKPHGVAVSPDGTTLYVTSRFSDALSVIDAASGAVVAEIAVGHQPHGVLTDALGEFVYVLNTGQDTISVIDAGELREHSRLPAGPGPWSLALRPDGRSLCVTNLRPAFGAFQEPRQSEITVVDIDSVTVRARPAVADANALAGIDFVPGGSVALFTLVRTKHLVPMTRLGQGWTITNGLGVLWPDGRVDQVLLDEPSSSFPDPGDVAVSPDGRVALVTSGGANEVAVIDVGRLLATITAASDDERRDVLPNHMGVSSRFVRKRVAVGTNPRGVIFAPDGRFAYVANSLDDSVAVLEAADFTLVGEIDLGGPDEITETRRGERLFHSAEATFARQFSCRSCHPEGHVNGLTFDIEADGIGMNPEDNRSLHGILDTAPFRWDGRNRTLKRQCGPRLAVFFTRLDPYSPNELHALVRFVSTIERPPNPHRRPEGLTLAQRRGKAVFDRAATNAGVPIPARARCVACHGGPYGSSGSSADVGTTMWFDMPVATEILEVDFDDTEQYGEHGIYYFVDAGSPTKVLDSAHLNNIYDGAPYLHNGSAATLEEIWTRFNVLSQHGMTDDLTRRQLNDLVAYLKAF